jgi:hypothetical protein
VANTVDGQRAAIVLKEPIGFNGIDCPTGTRQPERGGEADLAAIFAFS